jgi:two-component system sensor histidine kinase YesM
MAAAQRFSFCNLFYIASGRQGVLKLKVKKCICQGVMMNIHKLPWKKNVLRRLIFSFICILLPLFVLSMIIYNWGVHTLKQEISRSMSSQVSQYFGNLEQEFRRIQLLQYDCLTDDNLNALGSIPESMNNIERMESILRLQQRLNAIRNSSTYIIDVYAYIPSIQKKVSALTVASLNPEEFNHLRETQGLPGSQLRDHNSGLTLSAAYPTTSPGSSRKPIFMLMVEFSKPKLQENLMKMVNASDELLLMTSPEYTIATSGKISSDPFIPAFLSDHSDSNRIRTVDFKDTRYLAVYSYSPFFDAVLSKYVPVSGVFEPLEKFKSWFVMLAAVSVLIIVLYSLYAYKYIHKPLFKLVKAFRKVEHEDFSVRIDHEVDDEFRYIYARFNSMLVNLESLVDQVYKGQILTHRAELKQLQSQINPHFLYNSFFILNTMARLGDNDNLEQFTNQLGVYFQFITRSHTEEVTLADEVKHAKVYTEIQTTRFYGRNRVEFGELPEQAGQLLVPRLILQPVIENAFNHGLEQRPEGGLLKVHFEHRADELLLIVEDNGTELTAEKLGELNRSLSGNDVETTGLLNIHLRLKLKFGEGSGLLLERSSLGGMKATIRITGTGKEI